MPYVETTINQLIHPSIYPCMTQYQQLNQSTTLREIRLIKTVTWKYQLSESHTPIKGVIEFLPIFPHILTGFGALQQRRYPHNSAEHLQVPQDSFTTMTVFFTPSQALVSTALTHSSPLFSTYDISWITSKESPLRTYTTRICTAFVRHAT